MKRLPLALAAGALAITLTSCSAPATRTAAPAAGTSTSAAPSEAPAEEPSEPVDDGTAQFGDTYTWQDGLSVKVVDAGKYRKSQYAIGKGNVFRKFKITLTNNTDAALDPSLAQVSASSGETEGDQVFDSEGGANGAPDTKIRAGKKVTYTVAFGLDSADDITLEFAPDFSHDSVLYGN